MILQVYVYDRVYIPYDKSTVTLLDKLKKEFVYSNPEYYKKKRMGFWVDDSTRNICNYSFLIYKDENCFSVSRGGLEKVKNYLTKNDIEYEIVDERILQEPYENYECSYILRPDQELLMDAMIREETCIIRSPCGSGKGIIGIKFAEYCLNTCGNVLVIVWQSDLFNEWIDRISYSFGIQKSEIGIIKGAKKRIAPITVAMQQTLKNCIDDYKDEFSCVICDEIQRFAANTFVYTVDKIPSKYRIGMSASEKRHDHKEIYIYDMFGSVAEEIKQSKLVDKGAIHEVIIRIVPTNYNYYVDGIPYNEIQDVQDKNYMEMLGDMCENEERNDLIWDFMEPILHLELPSVVMSHRVKHVLYFDKRITKAGYGCGKVLGGVKYKDESISTIQDLKKGKLNVGIGTIPIKLGQAVDVPQWCRGFLLTPVISNKQQLEQISGRLTRKAEGKTEGILYIFWDKEIYPYFLKNIKKWYRYIDIYNYETERFEEL